MGLDLRTVRIDPVSRKETWFDVIEGLGRPAGIRDFVSFLSDFEFKLYYTSSGSSESEDIYEDPYFRLKNLDTVIGKLKEQVFYKRNAHVWDAYLESLKDSSVWFYTSY